MEVCVGEEVCVGDEVCVVEEGVDGDTLLFLLTVVSVVSNSESPARAAHGFLPQKRYGKA